MSFPVYITDDGKIFFKKEKDLGHNEFWEEEVSLYVAKKFKVSLQEIINLPYCQKRGRLVNEKFYFGEKPNKSIKNKLEKTFGKKIEIIYDDHEKMSKYDRFVFDSLKRILKT